MKLIFNSEISEFISNLSILPLSTLIQIWNIRKMIVTKMVLALIAIGIG